jgi:uncharacterized 2Fe-2S/4Fe-4S cluster protein (DUF4445 family)
MIDVTIVLSGDEIKTKANQGDNLLDVIRSAGVPIDSPCNGSGTCGKCRVKIVEGVIKQDNRKGGNSSENNNTVLACSCTITAPVTVVVPRESLLRVANIDFTDDAVRQNEYYYRIKEKFEALYAKESHIKKIDLELAEPSLDNNISDAARLRKNLLWQLACSEAEINVPLLKKIPLVLRENDFKVAVIYTQPAKDRIKLIDIKPYGEHIGYGIAVDVGTTSVAACLVDLQSDKVLGEAACANAQSKYGADVINRIIYATKDDGLQVLKDAVVRESINPLIRHLCKRSKISRDDIVIVSIAANTTMTHLLLGIYPDYLRREPYIPALTETGNLAVTVDDIGLCVNKNAQVLLSPSVASYVGGDITAGVLPSFIREKEKHSLLIDLGTNGEIVLGNKDYLITCACSAGPAFEGGEISCGMRAADGAIEGVTIGSDYVAQLDIIGGGKPYGICGSGIIDLIAELKRTGLIDARGKFTRKNSGDKNIFFDSYGGRYIVAAKERYSIPEDIYITEIDIDNFIRAKAAVYSAIYVLLSSLGLDISDIDEIKVAGGIGNHINIKNAVKIGLFPDISPDRVDFIGNSSLTGSYLSLINKNASSYIDETAQQMTYLELSVYPGYMDEFVSASFIPHTDLTRFPADAVV